MGIPRKTRKISTDNKVLSVRRHGEKRIGKLVHQSMTSVGSLPRDLLLDILARVASSSFVDLFNAKLSSKGFLELTNDDYIYHCISLDKFPVTRWVKPSKEEFSFLTLCFNKGNPESLFRQGMIDYFKLVNVESGLNYLEMATKKRHPEATYVYGMILLSNGGQSSQQGLNLLNSMNYSRSKHLNVQDCRDKIESMLSLMWINNPITLEKLNTKCKERDHAIRFQKRGWSLDEDREIASCDTCFWYRELVYFCKSMNVIV